MSAPTTTMSTDTTRRAETSAERSNRVIRGRGVVGSVVAIALNLVLWLIGRVADVSFVVPGRGGGSPVEVAAPHVVLTTLVPFAAGLALFALVGSRSRRWRLGILALAVLVTVGSLAMPLRLDTDAWTRTLLAAMHLLTGAVFVSAMASTPSPSTTGST